MLVVDWQFRGSVGLPGLSSLLATTALLNVDTTPNDITQQRQRGGEQVSMNTKTEINVQKDTEHDALGLFALASLNDLATLIHQTTGVTLHPAPPPPAAPFQC